VCSTSLLLSFNFCSWPCFRFALRFCSFGIGRFTTAEEVDFTVDKVVSNVIKLREMSPLWEMHQEGIDISKIEWSQH